MRCCLEIQHPASRSSQRTSFHLFRSICLSDGNCKYLVMHSLRKAEQRRIYAFVYEAFRIGQSEIRIKPPASHCNFSYCSGNRMYATVTNNIAQQSQIRISFVANATQSISVRSLTNLPTMTAITMQCIADCHPIGGYTAQI